jgi:hypothetical protein
MNMWLLHHRPEAQANTKSSMMTNQIVVPVLAEALVIAESAADSRARILAAYIRRPRRPLTDAPYQESGRRAPPMSPKRSSRSRLSKRRSDRAGVWPMFRPRETLPDMSGGFTLPVSPRRPQLEG